MKPVIKLLLATTLLIVFQPYNGFGQIEAAANIAAHGVLKLIGGGSKEKQEKIIEQSSTTEKINGQSITVLRVKESDIKSKTKNNIIALQNRLTQYYASELRAYKRYTYQQKQKSSAAPQTALMQ